MAVQAKRAKDDPRWGAENVKRAAVNAGRRAIKDSVKSFRDKEFSELTPPEKELLFEYMAVKLGLVKPPSS